MLAIIEHTLAIGCRNAAAASGGVLVAQDFLSPELLVAYGLLEG